MIDPYTYRLNFHCINVMQAFSAEKTMMGAMTYTFIKAIQEIPDITYQGLLDYVHKAIEKVNKARCPLLKVLQRKIDQVTHLPA